LETDTMQEPIVAALFAAAMTAAAALVGTHAEPTDTLTAETSTNTSESAIRRGTRTAPEHLRSAGTTSTEAVPRRGAREVFTVDQVTTTSATGDNLRRGTRDTASG
jgi:hypothetical protein